MGVHHLCRAGIVPLRLDRDTGGPLARTVGDVALMLEALVGYDADDTLTDLSNEVRADGIHGSLPRRQRLPAG